MSVYLPTIDERDFDPQRLIQQYVRCNKPFDICMKIQEKVLGQDAAVRQASLLVYAYLKTLADGTYEDYKYHFMIEAESGCGKSTFANALKSAVQVPVVICDASQITGAGWKGCDAADLLTNAELEAWGCGIIILDELDKAIMPQGGYAENHHRYVQESFLKMLDGGSVPNKDGKVFDCSRYLFIGMGAFTQAREEKEVKPRPIGFGSVYEPKVDKKIKLTRERMTDVCGSEQFMGRMVAILHFQRLGMGHYKIILNNVVNEVCRMYGNWQLPRDTETKILHEAISSPYGARNIRNRVWECFMDADSSIISHMKREEAIDRKLRQGRIPDKDEVEMIYSELFGDAEIA